jgi:uncharacterized protein YqeY
MPFIPSVKLACVVREIKQRKKAYPRWVKAGRMSLAMADYEIKVMEEIADDYRARMRADSTQELFGDSHAHGNNQARSR